MSSADPALLSLVDQLTAMDQLDRDSILTGLTEDECAKLLPLLTSGGEQPFSPKLSDLIRRCQVGQPTSLTLHTAAKLIEVVKNLSPRPEQSPLNRPDGWSTFWSRFSLRWLGRP